jgi:hypothetical protein
MEKLYMIEIGQLNVIFKTVEKAQSELKKDIKAEIIRGVQVN